MIDLRKLVIAAAFGTAMSAFAQTPATSPSEWTTRMDQQMTAMRGLHEQMVDAKTPAERNALMTAHWALMQNGMQMMGGMSSGVGPHGMAGMGSWMGPGGEGMGAMHGNAGAPADEGDWQQRMETRMEMMQSMMQLMIDRLPPEPAKK